MADPGAHRLGHEPRVLPGEPDRRDRVVALVPDRRGAEAQRVDARGLRRPRRGQLDVAVLPLHRDNERPSPAAADRLAHIVEGVHRHAVDPDDLVSGMKAGARGGGLRLHLCDHSGGVARDPDHVDAGEEDDREDQVRAGPGGDHQEPLPGSLPPVGVRPERVGELFQAPTRRPLRVRGELRLTDGALELGQSRLRLLEVALRHQALDALDRRQQARRLVQRRAEVHVEVGRRRPVHPRDLHVAAERNRADAVLDPFARRLQEGRRETNVEPARAHPDGACRGEVAGLVDQDQEREARDRRTRSVLMRRASPSRQGFVPPHRPQGDRRGRGRASRRSPPACPPPLPRSRGRAAGRPGMQPRRPRSRR